MNRINLRSIIEPELNQAKEITDMLSADIRYEQEKIAEIDAKIWALQNDRAFYMERTQLNMDTLQKWSVKVMDMTIFFDNNELAYETEYADWEKELLTKGRVPTVSEMPIPDNAELIRRGAHDAVEDNDEYDTITIEGRAFIATTVDKTWISCDCADCHDFRNGLVNFMRVNNICDCDYCRQDIWNQK